MTHRNLPARTPVNQPFWDATRGGRLALPHCMDCGHVSFPPGPRCPACLSSQLKFQDVSGAATLLSWVVMHRQYFPGFPPPYTVLFVRLDEGPLMMANPGIEFPREALRCGQRLRAVFEPVGSEPDAMITPRFLPDTSCAT
jgi:uncharacterized OB-fold protein